MTDTGHVLVENVCAQCETGKAPSVFTPISDLELVGYTTCNGCPGGNIEYTGEEMAKNGAQVIHLATGLLVGYPPCPYIDTFKDFLERRYGVKVILGTHPIPQKYMDMHTQLGTWEDPCWQSRLVDTMVNEETRQAYN